MDLPLAGFVGAMVGTIVAAIIFAALVGTLDRALRASDRSESAEQRAEFESRLSAVRRTVLGADIAAFAVTDYWLGQKLGG
jgi:hypothetical protein